ncbi:hypothetical protein [Roseimicrobium gellanilyticum]|nr:hypothetical protein [Roseimicrobium gellanilyticum]
MPIIDREEPDVLQIMVYPEMLRAYEAHLAKEYSSENMAFIRAVNDFRNKANDPSVTDAALKDQAASIYDHYMKKSATREVNLAAPNLSQFEGRMENLATLNRQDTVNMFDECHHEINSLIARDSFRRFVATKEFGEAADLVDDNFDVELRIPELREQAEHARLNPTVGDRMKSSVGGKTKAQELTEQADLLQQQLDDSRTVAPLDMPPTNTQAVIASTTVLAAQHRQEEARKEQERLKIREEAERIPPPPPDELDNDIPPPPPDELEVGNEFDIPPPPQELEVDVDVDGLEEPGVSQAQVGGDDDWPELEEQEVMQRGQAGPGPGPEPEMEIEELSMEELAGIDLAGGRDRGQRVDSIDLGQSRGRGQGMDGGEQGQTRARRRDVEDVTPPQPSVRDSLGHRDSQPKQGQGGPKVK